MHSMTVCSVHEAADTIVLVTIDLYHNDLPACLNSSVAYWLDRCASSKALCEKTRDCPESSEDPVARL